MLRIFAILVEMIDNKEKEFVKSFILSYNIGLSVLQDDTTPDGWDI